MNQKQFILGVSKHYILVYQHVFLFPTYSPAYFLKGKHSTYSIKKLQSSYAYSNSKSTDYLYAQRTRECVTKQLRFGCRSRGFGQSSPRRVQRAQGSVHKALLYITQELLPYLFLRVRQLLMLSIIATCSSHYM